MKKIIYSISVLLITILFISCTDDTSEGVSKITYYPILEMVGNDVVIIPVGGTYVDEGIIAKAGASEIEYKTTSTVDNSKIGVYYITYTAYNAEGYSASIARAVLVKSATPQTDDFTGNYRRNAGVNGISSWTKLDDGVFLVTDVGGSKNAAATVFALSIAHNQFIVPEQYLGGEIGNIVMCDDGSGGSIINYIPGSPDLYKWRVFNETYGTALRTFEKQ